VAAAVSLDGAGPTPADKLRSPKKNIPTAHTMHRPIKYGIFDL
jgi:hypothetical protein